MADTISFRDIIEAVEGPIALNLCVEGGTSCSLQPACRMFRVWEEGQRVLIDVFARTTLSEVASSRTPSFLLARSSASPDRAIAIKP